MTVGNALKSFWPLRDYRLDGEQGQGQPSSAVGSVSVLGLYAGCPPSSQITVVASEAVQNPVRDSYFPGVKRRKLSALQQWKRGTKYFIILQRLRV